MWVLSLINKRFGRRYSSGDVVPICCTVGYHYCSYTQPYNSSADIREHISWRQWLTRYWRQSRGPTKGVWLKCPICDSKLLWVVSLLICYCWNMYWVEYIIAFNSGYCKYISDFRLFEIRCNYFLTIELDKANNNRIF